MNGRALLLKIQKYLRECCPNFNVLDIIVVERLKSLVEVVGKYWSVGEHTERRAQSVFKCRPNAIDIRIRFYM